MRHERICGTDSVHRNRQVGVAKLVPVDGSSYVFRHIVQMFRQLYARQAQLSLQATSYSEIVLLPSEATSSSMLHAVGRLQLIPTRLLGPGAWPHGLFTWMWKRIRPLPSSLCLPLGPVVAVRFALDLIFVHRSSRTS